MNDGFDRKRSLVKIQTEFIEAATQGAVAVVQGLIAPINPMENKKAFVYVHNNIFFSMAVDGRNAYQVRLLLLYKRNGIAKNNYICI
jgi:protein TIF31